MRGGCGVHWTFVALASLQTGHNHADTYHQPDHPTAIQIMSTTTNMRGEHAHVYHPMYSGLRGNGVSKPAMYRFDSVDEIAKEIRIHVMRLAHLV